MKRQFRTIFISAEKFKNSPSARNMPNGIKKDAIPVWKYVTKNFGKQIRQDGKTLKEQWAMAVTLFKNICTKRGIMPFDFNILQQQQMRDKHDGSIHDKVKKSAKEAQKIVKNLLNKMTKEGLLDKPNPRWVYDRPIYADGRYHIAAYKKQKLGKDTAFSQLSKFLSKYKFFVKPEGNTYLTVDNNVTVSFNPNKQDTNKVFIYITLSLTKKEAEDLTAKEAGKKLETKLTKMGKGLLNV